MSTTPNRASNPAGKPRRKDTHLDLKTARRMLPLVRSIVTDIIGNQQVLTRLTPEQERLDRHRRDLVWQERERRYQVREEIATLEKKLANARTELTELGITLIDGEAGMVDFPTKVNSRAAAFSWQVGEDGISYWHYAGEELKRPIPTDWDQATSGVVPVRYRGTP